MIDYKWSSYPVYAYGKKCPDWLSTQTILSYFSGSNKHYKYREKVQRYAKEEKYFLENIQHGMILGAKTFVNEIREQYLPCIPHKDLPQQRQLAKDINVADLLKKIVELLQVDIDKSIQAKRLHGAEKRKRDLVVYFLWCKGLMTNEKIGQLFSMSYSSVSHCVKSFKKQMDEDERVKIQSHKFNSQFKL